MDSPDTHLKCLHRRENKIGEDSKSLFEPIFFAHRYQKRYEAHQFDTTATPAWIWCPPLCVDIGNSFELPENRETMLKKEPAQDVMFLPS